MLDQTALLMVPLSIRIVIFFNGGPLNITLKHFFLRKKDKTQPKKDIFPYFLKKNLFDEFGFESLFV